MNANFGELPHTLNVYGGNMGVSFVLSSKGTSVCYSSSSVLVPNRTSPSLLHTFVVDTPLNFPLPFNIPVILTYTNTSCVHAFGRLLVLTADPADHALRSIYIYIKLKCGVIFWKRDFKSS